MNIGLIPQKWARLTPNKVAVIDEQRNRRISFRELEDLVNKIANGLISIGLQKGDRVGILSKNSIEHLALFYACGRIGLIAQPMNWRLSSSEVIKIIENGNPSIVIVDSDLSELGKQVQAETDLVDRWFEYGETGDQSFESLVQAQSSVDPSPT
tara:strand:+ start:663 stop:1124 length:462 start_codon:yes stop_codon:yes gene_type:complete